MAGAPCRGWGEDSGRAAYLFRAGVGPPVGSESHDQAREIQRAAPTIGPVSMSRHNSPQGIAGIAWVFQSHY